MNRGFLSIAILSIAMPLSALAQERPPSPGPATSKATGMKLVLIRNGAFEMGSATSEEGHTRRESQHTVRISRPFYISVSEVTQADFETIMDRNPSTFSKTGSEAARVRDVQTARFPVENVSWFDAIEFCIKLSVADGLKPAYTIGQIEREAGSIKSAVVGMTGDPGYRLPTEAEWEYACRAGTTTAYNSGETISLLQSAGWFGGEKTSSSNSNQQPHPVGLKGSAGNGLFDMHGNVSEWCHDWYDSDFYRASPTLDPAGPNSGNARVLRGGSWNSDPVNCRSAARAAAVPGRRSPETGFRIVRHLTPPPVRNTAGIPPYRMVVDLRDGGTVDLFINETFDTIQAARQRLEGSKFFGKLNNIRIVDSNGDTVE